MVVQVRSYRSSPGLRRTGTRGGNTADPRAPFFSFCLNRSQGCSSFDGALMEVGPLRMVLGDKGGTKGKLREVSSAWNEYTNVLFSTFVRRRRRRRRFPISLLFYSPPAVLSRYRC